MNSQVVIWFQFILLVSITCAQTLKHPGVLVGGGQLAFIKTQVSNKVEPFYSAFTKAQASAIGSLTYKARGPPANRIIECGPTSMPDYGCSADDYDSSAAYLQSVLGYITDDQTYIKNSVTLLNTYAHGLSSFTNSNAPLQAGWSATKWARAAEIIKSTAAGSWAVADVAAFQKLLNSVHLPLIHNGSSSNGNWELTMIEGMIGIAVFSDDITLFNHAVDFWKQRVPAYFYYEPLDGNKPVPAPRGTANWYGQTTYNSSVNGIGQETCRDLGHLQYGLAATLNIAATAAIQGVDLFGLQRKSVITSVRITNHHQC